MVGESTHVRLKLPEKTERYPALIISSALVVHGQCLFLLSAVGFVDCS